MCVVCVELLGLLFAWKGEALNSLHMVACPHGAQTACTNLVFSYHILNFPYVLLLFAPGFYAPVWCLTRRQIGTGAVADRMRTNVEGHL